MNSTLKKLKIFLIIVSLITSNISLANDAKFIAKNTPAPFTGYLFTESTTKEIRIQLLERDKYKLENQSLIASLNAASSTIDIYEKQVQILTTRNDELAVALTSAKTTTFWERALWFGIGAVAVGLGVYVGNQVTQR